MPDKRTGILPIPATKNSIHQGLAFCNLIFKIETALADLSPEERYDQQLKQAKPVLDTLLAWASTRAAAPKSALAKALTYSGDYSGIGWLRYI